MTGTYTGTSDFRSGRTSSQFFSSIVTDASFAELDPESEEEEEPDLPSIDSDGEVEDEEDVGAFPQPVSRSTSPTPSLASLDSIPSTITHWEDQTATAGATSRTAPGTIPRASLLSMGRPVPIHMRHSAYYTARDSDFFEPHATLQSRVWPRQTQPQFNPPTTHPQPQIAFPPASPELLREVELEVQSILQQQRESEQYLHDKAAEYVHRTTAAATIDNTIATPPTAMDEHPTAETQAPSHETRHTPSVIRYIPEVLDLKDLPEEYYANDGVVPLFSQWHPGACIPGVRCVHDNDDPSVGQELDEEIDERNGEEEEERSSEWTTDDHEDEVGDAGSVEYGRSPSLSSFWSRSFLGWTRSRARSERTREPSVAASSLPRSHAQAPSRIQNRTRTRDYAYLSASHGSRNGEGRGAGRGHGEMSDGFPEPNVFHVRHINRIPPIVTPTLSTPPASTSTSYVSAPRPRPARPPPPTGIVNTQRNSSSSESRENLNEQQQQQQQAFHHHLSIMPLWVGTDKQKGFWKDVGAWLEVVDGARWQVEMDLAMGVPVGMRYPGEI